MLGNLSHLEKSWLENNIHTFERSKLRSIKCVKLLHIDLCDPMNPTSKGGTGYILTFIDDFSSKIQVYLLKQKDEV